MQDNLGSISLQTPDRQNAKPILMGGAASSVAKTSEITSTPLSVTETHSESTWDRLTADQQSEIKTRIESEYQVKLSFSIHEKTGRTIMRITDPVTNDVIREIPPEDILNVLAKIDEVSGMLFSTDA